MATAATLNDFFGIDASAQDWIDEISGKDDFDSFKGLVADALKNVPVPGNIAALVIEQLSDLLNIDIRAILVKAWSENEALQKYLNPDLYPPGEDVQVALAEHSVVSEHTPSLQPVINGIPVGELSFHIILNLTLKGVILHVRDGRIMEVASAACEGGGEVSFGEYTLLKKEPAAWDLPGRISLGEGVPIRDYSEEMHNLMAGLGVWEPANAEPL